MEGYRFGLKQPVTRLTLQISIPPHFCAHAAKKWLRNALDADIEHYEPLYLKSRLQASGITLYMKMVFLTLNVLLQDIRVPVFQPIAVEEIETSPADSGVYTIKVWVPNLDGFSINILKTWLNQANQLLLMAHQVREDSSELEELYRHFHSQYLDPWLKIMPGGKSTIPILQAAWELNIPFKQIVPGKYILGWGSQSKWFDRSSNNGDSAIGALSTQNKDVAIQAMKAAGLPTPMGMAIHSTDYQFESLKAIKMPWVVKPADRDRGEGVTLNVSTKEELVKAINVAAQLSQHILVEEQVPGTCYRILVVSGKIVYVVKRNPRSVIGDGIRTIEELIKAKNSEIRRKIPIKRLPELLIDDATIKHLSCINKTQVDIPKCGEQIFLRPVQSTAWGGEPEVVTHLIHPDNADIAIRAAALFNLSCAGVDLISTDISEPWHGNGAVINEVNFSPVLGRTHEYQREGIRRYLSMLFPTQGKVPIEIFVGSHVFNAVNERRKSLLDLGHRVFLADEHTLIDHHGKPIHFSNGNSLFQKISMLRADKRMQWLLVHLEHDHSFVQHGIPFEYLNKITYTMSKPLTEKQAVIVNMLKPHLNNASSVEYV